MMKHEGGPVYAGIDTHADTHHVAVIDGRGRPLGDVQVPATAGGYRQAVRFIGRWTPRSAPLLRQCRRIGCAGDSPSRHHRRDLVAGDRSRHPHRALQRPLRGLQPARETRRPQRLRLPQPDQPTPPDTLGVHPPTPAGRSHHHRAARSSAMSHFDQAVGFTAGR